MKLRNKKTGEIIKPYYVELRIWHDHETPEDITINSLAELNEEWEDYKPAEPLIKDEKIRKAVRAWADVTGTTSVCYWGAGLESEQNDSKIGFDDLVVVEFGDNYTIAELCGEEEE